MIQIQAHEACVQSCRMKGYLQTFVPQLVGVAINPEHQAWLCL